MRRLMITSMLLLAACGPKPVMPALELLDLTPCPGWTGPRPATVGAFARAAAAERAGRLCANAKLEDVAGIAG